VRRQQEQQHPDIAKRARDDNASHANDTDYAHDPL
jgi:hypothetical protein